MHCRAFLQRFVIAIHIQHVRDDGPHGRGGFLYAEVSIMAAAVGRGGQATQQSIHEHSEVPRLRLVEWDLGLQQRLSVGVPVVAHDHESFASGGQILTVCEGLSHPTNQL